MKLNIFFVTLLLSIITQANAQNVGIGTNTPDVSAKLDIVSTNTGFLIPRINLGDVTVFGLSGGTATSGMMIFNTNASIIGGEGIGFYYWNSGVWNYVANGKVLDASLDNGKIWIGNGSNEPQERTINGDALINNAGVLDLEDNAVETSEILNNAVNGAKINLTGNTNGDLMYYNGTDWTRLASGTSGQVLVSNGATTPSWSFPTDILIFRNALTETSPNIVELGGSLVKNTTVTQGGFNMIHNLTGTGNFIIQDGGNDRLRVYDNGRVEMNGTTDASGTVNTGVLEIGNSLRIDGNEIITNNGTTLSLQHDNNSDLQMDGGTFYMDASANRVGIATSGPTRALDVNGTVRIRGGVPIQGKVLTAQDVNGNATWGYALPKGSIVAWHKNGGTGIGTLPAEWRECNGGSAVNGVNIPDLNSSTTSVSGDVSRGRFLRGNTTSGLLQNDDANNFEQIESSDTDQGTINGVRTIDDDGNWSSWMATSRDGGDRDPLRFKVAGVENRVMNMSVVWIIKVY